jgi:hypothetical protein
VDAGGLRCVLSGGLCGLTILDDVNGDGTRQTQLISAPFVVSAEDWGSAGIARSLTCKGLIVGRKFDTLVLQRLDQALESISL